MKIFDQIRQTVTKRNCSYSAKQFDRIWTKTALYRPETYVAASLLNLNTN
jgi:hypothetical protein